MAKRSRLDMYLQWSLPETYVNTDEENSLVNKFEALYSLAKSAHDKSEQCNPENLAKWRKAYYGTLNALDSEGKESKRKSRQLRKLVYEFIESKVDNSIPMPKMKARYKSDLPLVNITENYLKYEVNRRLTKYENDRSERATYIDGTGWYKISWDSLANVHERSGDVRIDFCTADQIIPQPGVIDYRQLEYIFEIKEISTTQIYDLYGREMTPDNSDSNMVKVISCYYLNENRIVGLFSWCDSSLQVICNEKDWQIRKLRKCTTCGTINPVGDTCKVCGGKHFKYENADTEILEEDLYTIYNPYDVGESDNPQDKDKYEKKLFLSAGTEIPFYRLQQLPFVPRPAISSLNSIYGTSEVFTILDMQDAVNKVLTKAFDKTIKSGAVITKPEKVKMSDTDASLKVLGVRTLEESQMIQAKQLVADTSQDLVMASLLYESARSTSGVTESFQGKSDSSATSGKAKQYSAMLASGRIESLRIMKASAFAGVYELVLKYLLAFSDEPRTFVKVLPDGKEEEQTWSKYMFLSKDKYGEIYYRDDFTFETDTASSLTENRQQMWQETLDKFTMGAFGNASESRTLELFWNVMDSLHYPLAKVVLSGIRDNSEHLPEEIERAILTNPELQQMVIQAITEGQSGSGGARVNSGPKGNGATHNANVERTNAKNRALNQEVAFSPQESSGGA